MFVSWSFFFHCFLGQDWQKSGKTGPPKGSFSIFKLTVWPSFHGSWPSWILHKVLPESRLLIGSAHLVLFQFLCEDQDTAACWVSEWPCHYKWSLLSSLVAMNWNNLWPKQDPGPVTLSKLVLLASWQASKSRDSLLRARNSECIWKASRWRRWCPKEPSSLR